MTDLELMRQALDALENGAVRWKSDRLHDIDVAIYALRARLAQPEPEPVAWSVTLEGDHIGNFYIKQQDAEEAMHDLNKDWPQWVRKAVPLYTAPPQREWQGLTDEEETELIKKWAGELVFEVTQALKEKNT